MARPLTHAQAFQNRSFLIILARDGNARAVGLALSTLMHRRKQHPGFAQKWDAAIASSQARLNAKGGRKGPEARKPAAPGAHRTAGGEPVVVRTRDGRIQVRAAHPNKLTKQCEQAFLLALSATANVRLSAAAAGASVAAFYRRRRMNPGFDREWRLALERGYREIDLALIAGFMPEAHEDSDWQVNHPPAMPPMTVNQALQLMYLHHKEAMGKEPPWMSRRRAGESWKAYDERMAQWADQRDERAREQFHTAEAARAAGTWTGSTPEPLYTLPDLAQVTGWSKADPAKVAWDEKRALFGGWRLEEMEARLRGEEVEGEGEKE